MVDSIDARIDAGVEAIRQRWNLAGYDQRSQFFDLLYALHLCRRFLEDAQRTETPEYTIVCEQISKVTLAESVFIHGH